jgi:hypothetical protein
MTSDASSAVDLNESRAGEYAATIIATGSITLVTLALRLYTRLGILGTLFADDYCIIGGIVSTHCLSKRGKARDAGGSTDDGLYGRPGRHHRHEHLLWYQ